MSIMAKTPSGYKKIGSAYLGERPVDKVFNANGDVIYALQRELTGVPPLLFKGKEQSELLNYRICGDTVDGNSVGDLVESGQHAGEYAVPVTVEGKNLLQNTATSQTIKGVTFTVNEDGSIVCDGQASPSTAVLIFSEFLVPSGAYILTGCPNGGSETKTYKMLLFINGAWFANDIGSGAKFTLTKTSTVSVRIDIYNGYTCDNLTFYPMIRKADIEDDTYEPYHAPVTTPIYLPEPIKMVGDEAEYIDFGEQKQHRVRKNLLRNTATSQTINGVTFTVNEDGSVTCDGTASNTTELRLISSVFSLPIGTYELNGAPTGGGWANNFKLDLRVSPNTYYADIGNGAQFNILQAETIENCRIVIYSGYTCDNLTFYPMIRLATIEDDTYEPYIESTDIDVTLPALPTLTGTNTMSIDTEVQPSRMDIKGRIKSLT